MFTRRTWGTTASGSKWPTYGELYLPSETFRRKLITPPETE